MPAEAIVMLLVLFCISPLLIVVILPIEAINVVVPKFPALAFPVTLNVPPVDKLPPVTVPVAVTIPPVPKLPTLALPVTVNVPPVDRLPPVTVPVAVTIPLVPILPILALPTTLTVPEILAPVDVTTNCAVALPAIKVETLPPDASVILLVPLLINGMLALVVNIPCVAPKLPTLALPTTLAVPGILAPVDVIVN